MRHCRGAGLAVLAGRFPRPRRRLPTIGPVVRRRGKQRCVRPHRRAGGPPHGSTPVRRRPARVGGSVGGPGSRVPLPGYSSARERGAQRARQRGQSTGQARGQQIRAVGKSSSPDTAREFIGVGEQGLAVGPAGGIPEQAGDDRGCLARPRPQRRRAGSGAAKAWFQADQGLTSQLRRLSRCFCRATGHAVTCLTQQAGDQPERDSVPGPPRPAAGAAVAGLPEPARPATQASTAPVSASPASALRSATLAATDTAVHASTLVPSTTGSVRPR